MSDSTKVRRPPEVTRDPMEFLSRSWCVSANHKLSLVSAGAETPAAAMIPEYYRAGDPEDFLPAVAGNSFTFATSATSKLLLERIMSLSEVSSMAPGRLSHSSGPLCGGQNSGSMSPVSPTAMDDDFKANGNAAATPRMQNRVAGGGGGMTVGRWLKDRRERKKEESRSKSAQLHAAVSLAGVAAAVAAIAAATAAASVARPDDRAAARVDTAVASAATLMAAQCVEAAEAMGAERDHLAAVVASAVSVRTPGDVVTLTAAAATALRGAATLKARALKEVWNLATVIPVEKGGVKPAAAVTEEDDNFMLGLCSEELLARGTELLKRTRSGELHWKIVSVYMNRAGQVVLKTKSRHVAGTITKKKKSVVVEVCRDVPAWPGRPVVVDGGERWWRYFYFGVMTAPERRRIEFECRSEREFEMWTRGVARLLAVAREKKKLAAAAAAAS